MTAQQTTLDEKVDGLVTTVGDLVVIVKANTEAIAVLTTKVDGLTERIDGVVESIEDLARMTKDGFDAVDKRFDKIEERLERIEIIHITDHKKRIERLEDQVKELIAAGR